MNGKLLFPTVDKVCAEAEYFNAVVFSSQWAAV